jgi:hypothetical protein
MICRLAVCAALAALLSPIQARADDDGLEITFNDHCRECHSFVKDDNRLGPSLYGVVGRKAGVLPRLRLLAIAQGYWFNLGRAHFGQVDCGPRRRDLRQPDEPALRRHHGRGDAQEDHHLPEVDLADGYGRGAVAASVSHAWRRQKISHLKAIACGCGEDKQWPIHRNRPSSSSFQRRFRRRSA